MKTTLALALTGALPAFAQSNHAFDMPVVTVAGERVTPLSHFVPDDSSQLLISEPGYNVATNDFSGFPVVNGEADDRLRIRVDGMKQSAACGNHMNPPLSYLAPRQIAKISLLAGDPVSTGGDNIGGVIGVHTAQPASPPLAPLPPLASCRSTDIA